MLGDMEEHPTTVTRFDIWLSSKQALLTTCHEVMFSLNLAYSVGYALLLCIAKDQLQILGGTPHLAWGYYLGRSVVRINDLLGLNSKAAVSTTEVGRGEYWPHWIGLEITLFVSVVGIAVIIFAILRAF